MKWESTIMIEICGDYCSQLSLSFTRGVWKTDLAF